MPDDENYQINQHPWLVLTTPAQAPDTMSCQCRGVMFSAGTWPPRADPGSGSREISQWSQLQFSPHRLSTLHWEHYPHRILRHCRCLCLALTSQQTLVHTQIFYFESLHISRHLNIFQQQNVTIVMKNYQTQVGQPYRYPHPLPIAHHKILMRYVLLPVFHFIITPGPYLRQPLNFPSKDQICLILKLNFHVPTTASLAAH